MIEYSPKTTGRLFGSFFLLSSLTSGTGSALIDSTLAVPDVLAAVQANGASIVAGALLMAVLHSFANLALPALLLPMLKRHNPVLAYGYLSAAIGSTMILVVGVIFLLLLLPLAEAHLSNTIADSGYFEVLGLLLMQGGFFSHQLGMTIWGLGGLLLCTILLQSQVIPRTLSVWGLIGYAIFVYGTMAEIPGFEVGLLLSAPGGLFEISLSLWLIVKGFRSAAPTRLEPRMVAA
jgi:hypothetical protein